MHKLKIGLIVACLAFLSAGCLGSSQADQQRTQAIQSRAAAFAKAQALYPAPNVSNFPLRKALVEYTQRQDELNHPWYVYILGQNGNPIGYYVASTAPQNACDYLSSTQQVDSGSDGKVVLNAPSYNGYFQNSNCDQYFFLDKSTGAVIQIQGLPFWVSDKPLALDVQPIKVASQ